MSRRRSHGLRPCDVIRRDLDRHVSLCTFIGSLVNAHTQELGFHAEWGQRQVGMDLAFYFEGIRPGILMDMVVWGAREGPEGPEEYDERRRREAAETAQFFMTRE